MTRALVALGSNIPPRRAHLAGACDDLASLPDTRVLSVSRWIETAPVDAPPGSGPFLNGACLLETGLDPWGLLDALRRIELSRGRTRDVPHGPRTLDLDLILHGDCVLRTDRLVLPHPRAHERAFVLRPAAEVAPDMRHPVLRRTLAELAAELPEDGRPTRGRASPATPPERAREDGSP